MKQPHEMSPKERAIDVIKDLYPSDSQFPETNAIGKQFMVESINEVGFDWRELPEDVLVRWAEKCLDKERADDRRLREKYGK